MSDPLNQMMKDVMGDENLRKEKMKEWEKKMKELNPNLTKRQFEEFLHKDAGTIPVNPGLPKAHGLRYNDGKLKWSYVNWKAIEPMVRVLMYGAQKYSPDNWKKGLKKEEVLESAMRHLTKLIDGEMNDPESGLSHIGHLMCNAMFYQYMVDNFNEKNDPD
jgi:hypothetical protein